MRAFASIAAANTRTRADALHATLDRVLNSGFLPDATCLNADINQAKISLQNAWGTELLLGVGERVINAEELIRLSNNWSVVQAYYVFYHATQALAVSRGFPRPDSHPKTQNQFHNMFAGRGAGLEPWTMAFSHSGPQNVPAGVNVNDQIHSWTTCDPRSQWSLAYKALRTTREDALPERERIVREEKRKNKRRAWKEEEQQRLARGRKSRKEPKFRLPRLTIAEKEDVNRRLRAHTLIDYLFRLRIRTNYEDSAMFTDGPERNGQSGVVRNDLLLLVACSLLVVELHIRLLVGSAQFSQWVTDWVSANAQFEPPIGVAERWLLFNNVII